MIYSGLRLEKTRIFESPSGMAKFISNNIKLS
jgi:hypothetical protein